MPLTSPRSLIGSYLGSAVPSHDIPYFVGLWRAGRLPVEKLVSSTITLDEINTGMDQLADGKAVALDVMHHAGLSQRRGGIGDATDDVLGIDGKCKNTVGIE